VWLTGSLVAGGKKSSPLPGIGSHFIFALCNVILHARDAAWSWTYTSVVVLHEFLPRTDLAYAIIDPRVDFGMSDRSPRRSRQISAAPNADANSVPMKKNACEEFSESREIGACFVMQDALAAICDANSSARCSRCIFFGPRCVLAAVCTRCDRCRAGRQGSSITSVLCHPISRVVLVGTRPV